MYKKTGLYALVCLFILIFACSSPTTPSKRGPGPDEIDKPVVSGDEDEMYPEEGITVKVKLMANDSIKNNVEVEEGRAIIGSQGFSGLSDDTVWIEMRTGSSPQSPEDIKLLPLGSEGAIQTFVPWNNSNLPPGFTKIKIISSITELGKIKLDSDSANTVYVMSRDLDAVGTWSNTVAISSDQPFKGWFNGGGYTIKNLKLPASAISSIFGFAEGAYIENLRVTLASADQIKATEHIYISPIVSRVVGASSSGRATKLKRIAVSMDKNQSSVIAIGSPPSESVAANQRKVFFGGIAASLESAAPVVIEECAVFVKVSANTEFAMSNAPEARVSIGGLVGDITGTGQVIIRNNYTLGSASATGVAPPVDGNYNYNYPKYVGGLVGFFANGPNMQTSSSMIYYNYAQFDCEVSGGTGVYTIEANKLYRAASGLVGAKGGSADAYLNIHSNFVMTENLSVNDKSTKNGGVIDYHVRRIVFLNDLQGNAMPPGTLVDDDSGNNFANKDMKMVYNESTPTPAGTDVPSSQMAKKIIIQGEDLDAGVFAEEESYIVKWDFTNIWIMGFKRPVNYNMANGKGIKTTSNKHYGGYPYPTFKWLGAVLPVPTYDFKPIAYPRFDEDGYDADGFDRDGYHRESKLDREGYDMWKIYGGIENGIDYYTYEEYNATNMTMAAPGFGWSSLDYYTPTTTASMVTGDWKAYGVDDVGHGNVSVLQTVPVPKDNGQITGLDYAYGAAKGLPCPWVDRGNDGYHDLLGLDSAGFARSAEGGLNLYGYDSRGVHSEGYDKSGQEPNGGASHSTGFDIYGFPCPWIDANADGYNDISGLDVNWQANPNGI